MSIQTKECINCETVKNITEFRGRRRKCKKCENKERASRYVPNPEKKEIAPKKFSEFMKQLKEKRKSDKKIFKDILVSIDNLTYYKQRDVFR